MRGISSLLIAAALLTGATSRPPSAPAASPQLDAAAILQARYGNDAPWYRDSIPLFDSADPTLNAVYYYRWSVFRAHQRDLGKLGYVSTEFLDDVGWQREPYASLNDASGFHLYEARWLRDRRYAGDYIDYLYDHGGNDRHFSEAIADAVYARMLVDGDRAAAIRHLPAMRRLYAQWSDHFDTARQLYWIEPLLDATEYTISSIDSSNGKDGFTGGEAYRPSINAYMFANARAITRLSALAGDGTAAADYATRAMMLRDRVQDALWNPSLAHFTDRYRASNGSVREWQPIRGRELVGYLPWTYGLAADTPTYAAAWRHILAADELAGPFGSRTVEPSYQYYMRQYRYDKDSGGRECQWNGPVWPFQTTQVLTAMANLLHDYHQSVVTRSDYMRLLRQYARLHYQGSRLDLEEDYDPATGTPIVGLARSHHYFHSGFDDLVISGVAGIRPREDDVLEIDPLIPADSNDPQALGWFLLQDVPYHGHLVTLVYDADGRHYRVGAGLAVYIDGRLAGRSAHLSRLTLPLSRRAVPQPSRTIDQSVQLARGEFPKGSASNRADPEKIHEAIDGRVMFFPESPNGWEVTATDPETIWFAVDFGRAVRTSAAQLAFYADNAGFAQPASYRLQWWQSGGWRDFPLANQPSAQGNGVVRIHWPPRVASRIRVLLRRQKKEGIRLVEFKIF